MPNKYEELITIDELCEILYIGRNAAYQLLKNKEIKAFRIGRVWKIPRLAIEEYIIKQSSLHNSNTQSTSK